MAGPPTELPQELHQFKLIAPQIIRGGEKKNLYLVKYPPADIEQDEDRVKIISTWKEWWSRTEWAMNPTAGNNPRWNSAIRTGQIWAQFGEAADSINGHPYVFCFNCSMVLQHPTAKNIGTKHLTTHIKTQGCRDTLVPIHNQLALVTQSSRPQNGTTPSPIPSYSTLALEKELVRVVIDNNWSFRTIERPSFQRFLRFLRPETAIISRYKF
jgi:hypothetical protein